MRRRLTAAAAGAAVVLAAGGCGAPHRLPSAGASSYQPPPTGSGAAAAASPAPTAPLGAGTGTATAAGAGTAGLSIGGEPQARTHLSSGATPAASPVITVRGVTWPAKGSHPIPPFPLPAGGYEAQYSVSAERDNKTKQIYSCTVSLSVTGPGGAVVYRTPPQAPGSGQGTFVVHSAVPAAQAAGSGPVGCNWTLTLMPA